MGQTFALLSGWAQHQAASMPLEQPDDEFQTALESVQVGCFRKGRKRPLHIVKDRENSQHGIFLAFVVSLNPFLHDPLSEVLKVCRDPNPTLLVILSLSLRLCQLLFQFAMRALSSSIEGSCSVTTVSPVASVGSEVSATGSSTSFERFSACLSSSSISHHLALGKSKVFSAQDWSEAVGRSRLSLQYASLSLAHRLCELDCCELPFATKFAPRLLERKAVSATRGDRQCSSPSRLTHQLFRVGCAKRDNGG